ncbi:hypothetical protein HanRHA438_Chr13g0616031 [Helianthus annuus]|nr:hypothetical protein HanRHA438_Chr13g0616031 [Helianthus annuus]
MKLLISTTKVSYVNGNPNENNSDCELVSENEVVSKKKQKKKKKDGKPHVHPRL